MATPTSPTTWARVHEAVIQLVHRCVDIDQLARDVRRALVQAVPFDGSCLSAVDPATLLPTRSAVEHGLPPAETMRLYAVDDDGRRCTLGPPDGLGDELRAALTTTTGTWGALTLLRGAERPPFSESEARFVDSLATPLAEGLRRATLVRQATADAPDDAGLVVLRPDGTVASTNQAGERWLDELEAGERSSGLLPTVVRAVAAQARRTAAGRDSVLARARVQTRSGRWAVVRGSLLGDVDDAAVAVMFDVASAPDLAPLIADAFGLTERERRITELVARGCATSEIATRLHLSVYTVQDHLKAIFDRTDVRSRGELVARLFFGDDAPRLTMPIGGRDRAVA